MKNKDTKPKHTQAICYTNIFSTLQLNFGCASA